jgi:hypothetical protein
MKNTKIKILIENKILDAEIKQDLHFLGGKKVVYKLPNGTTGVVSEKYIKIVKNEEVI